MKSGSPWKAKIKARALDGRGITGFNGWEAKAKLLRKD